LDTGDKTWRSGRDRADEVKSPNQALKRSTQPNHENHPQTKSPRHRTGPGVDFENAARGFIAKPDTLTIKKAHGQPVWDIESYKAYISLDKPAVRDANETMMKNNRNAKSGKREMNEEY
jgi:alkyl sulfatase BDS1-like metallo-beta-lactamase superfamily hydrolase